MTESLADQVDGQSRKDRSESRWREIYDRAAGLFARKGYHATGMNELCDATGLGKGALYHYIGSKADLLVQMHWDVMNEIMSGAQEIASNGESAPRKLRELGIDLVRIIVERPDPVRVFMREWTALPEAEAVALSNERRKYLEILEAVLLEGCADGSFVISNCRLAALQWVGCHNYVFTWFSPQGELSPVDVAEGFYETFISGMASASLRDSLSR